jgi:3-hydroxy-9,10-secoandrosta-1,3,5(10)-triene-9,17-dione monooxygenase reductase component
LTGPTSIDSRQFRDALGSFATGITIVTTRTADGVDIGVTANSFNSVSLSPPMVLWSLSKSSHSRPAFAAAAHFAVHVLSASQELMATRFAQRGVDKFAGLAVQRGPDSIPLLDGCSARFQCRTTYRYEGGDHEIIVGEVVAFDAYNLPPLAYHRGRYGSILPKNSLPNTTSTATGAESSFSQDFLGFLLGQAHFALFHDIRKELIRFQLDVDDFFVLCVLGFGVPRTAAALDAMASHYDRRVSAATIAGLLRRQMVEIATPAASEELLSVSATGHHTMLELLAIGKSAEADATEDFDYAETQMFKELLRRLIRKADPGIPRLKNR